MYELQKIIRALKRSLDEQYTDNCINLAVPYLYGPDIDSTSGDSIAGILHGAAINMAHNTQRTH